MSDSPRSAQAGAKPSDVKPDLATDQIVVMYSTQWCGDCRRARRVFAAMGVAYQEIDVEREPRAAERVRELNRGMQSVPTILFPDGSVLVEPSNRELEAKLRQLA